ncbi:MAG TPA: hypothetical protein VFS02_17330 [Telluria sp.]|nr:hypothetical protein [Telluria sp.]
MIRRLAIWSLMAMFPCLAMAECLPIEVGYLDQHRPPYWLGVGTTVPAVPGAGAELIRRFTASAGCPAAFLRMPVLRIKPAVAAGEIDFGPMQASARGTPGIVFPLDKHGRLDRRRSIPMSIVVFVRAGDQASRGGRPFHYFHGRTLGTTLGSAYVGKLRESGFLVDSGGVDVASNFEKLRLRRFDGFAVSLIAPGDMDSYVAAKYHGDIVRVAAPLLSDHIWLAASQKYYSRHPQRVEAMWDWLGTSGKKEFGELLSKYYDMH